MYSQAISPSSPGCLIFLLDQSFSMTEPLTGPTETKAQALSAAVNRFLIDVISWSWAGAAPSHYFDIGVLGYTTDRAGRPLVRSLLHGPLAGRDLVSVVELQNHPLAVEVCRGDGDDVEFPIWHRVPPAETMLGTPACAALRRCRDLAAAWTAAHPDSFPPAVLHLTDGECTDGDPEGAAADLQAVATRDGNLLLWTCQLAGTVKEALLFPAAERQLSGDWSRLLFRVSSLLPPQGRLFFEARGVPAAPGARCLAVNADAARMLWLYRPDDVVLTLDADEAAPVPPAPAARERPPYRTPRCPGCDRKAPGLPGRRYCMICERTF